jgi:NADH:ubiquinone oxidoreductase subunit 6 (subunit J)
VGVLLFFAGLLMRLFPPLWFAAQYLSSAGVVVAGLAVWLSTPVKGTRPPPVSVVGYLLAIVVLFLFPVILVSLATGGSGSSIAYFAYFWRPRHIGLLRTELNGLLATPLFLVP